MYCGANILVDFMPSIGASFKAIGEKITGTHTETEKTNEAIV
jgi:hypothetical protein